MKTGKVVIGANFGDEGKGLMTDYLCYKNQGATVVRYNGGAQAGHTVSRGLDLRHVFHHFGSGTLRQAPTFLSKHFIVHPGMFVKEHDQLSKLLAFKAISFVDEQALISTPFDGMINSLVETVRGKNKHGSCGMGINETVKRSFHEQGKFKTTVHDTLFKEDLTQKLHKIHAEYVPLRLKELGFEQLVSSYLADTDARTMIANYNASLTQMHRLVVVVPSIKTMNSEHTTFVFEGAQGLLLDEDHYFFPHVTRSKPGLPNVIELAHDLGIEKLDIFYMTRAYLTRHGAGPLPFELRDKPHKNIVDDTNIPNEFQGALRFAPLNLDLLEESITSDLGHDTNGILLNPQLVITCLDQVEGEGIRVIYQSGLKVLDQIELINLARNVLPISAVHGSFGPMTGDVVENLDLRYHSPLGYNTLLT